MDFYRQQLREQRHRLPPQVTYHCVDGYFAKKKYLDDAVRLNLHLITKLRCDADCRFLYSGPYSKRRGARRKYDGKVNFQDLRRFASLGTLAEADHLHLYTSVVWHVTLQRKLRLVVVVNRKPQPRHATLCWPPRLWPWTATSWWSCMGRVSRSSFVPRQQTAHRAE